MALQSGTDGKAKNRVLERGAKLEVLQPSAHCWAEAEGCGRCDGSWVEGGQRALVGFGLCETEAVRHPRVQDLGAT